MRTEISQDLVQWWTFIRLLEILNNQFVLFLRLLIYQMCNWLLNCLICYLFIDNLNGLLDNLLVEEFYLLCSPLKVNQSFGGICRLHLHGRIINQTRNQHEAGRKHSDGLHDVISHKIKLFINHRCENLRFLLHASYWFLSWFILRP
jgi:hypothetical protein